MSKRPKLVRHWKSLIKSYSVLFSLANILQAVSIAGLGVLGVINIFLAFKLATGLAVLFAALGILGRIVAQPSLPCSVANASPVGNNRLDDKSHRTACRAPESVL